MPIADSSSITFSARTRVFIGEYGTAQANLTHVGLLGGPASLTVDIQYRQKRDQYPRRPVAAAIKSIDATLQAQLEEWQAQNLMWAMGFWQEDVTDHGSREQEVTCLLRFNTQGIAVLPHPVKLGTSVTLSGLVEAQDFVTIPRDLEGRTLLYRLDPDLITATATYTSHTPDYRELIIGNSPSRFFTVRLEEEDTTGHLTVLILHRARITLRPTEGKSFPLTFHAILDTDLQRLLTIRAHYTGDTMCDLTEVWDAIAAIQAQLSEGAAHYGPQNHVPLSDIATSYVPSAGALTDNGGSGNGYAFYRFTVTTQQVINRFGFPATTAMTAGVATLTLKNITENLTLYEEEVTGTDLQGSTHWVQTSPMAQELLTGVTYEIRMDFTGTDFHSTRTFPYTLTGIFSRVDSWFTGSGAGGGLYPAWRIQAGKFQGVEGNLLLENMPVEGLTTTFTVGGVTLTFTNGVLTGKTP
ncbi:hypothetical protein [Deinococcus cellulosilyticus]|uniref:Uncharacterized protein n=1 Tax=Deinococcus cellulosilyticus (strain DSM 18568 / NBRC 106333 / KACC 11606 / 5516J-15) TaxID=1223518 RepID=A0A511N2Z7_DEIC1|nr:hypothetical protein [Deinococcus cellulosilyticus]GEM47222.1 hypothetical protein DC3_28570 [Deinococcus cellulosilyticus NBRC 106333 = KACC 11606]